MSIPSRLLVCVLVDGVKTKVKTELVRVLTVEIIERKIIFD